MIKRLLLIISLQLAGVCVVAYQNDWIAIGLLMVLIGHDLEVLWKLQESND